MNTFTEKPTRGRALQKEETRARILRAAREHFEAHGFDGTNVRAIAGDAGVAAGTVLLHFQDKRDLLHAALFDDLENVVDRAVNVRPAGASNGRLEARLRAVARPFFRYYQDRPLLSKTLLREALLAEDPWRERFTAQVARIHAHVAGLAESAKSSGELASTADAALLGASFFSFYYFALLGWVQGGFTDPAPVFERLLAEHLRGLAARTEPRKKR